MFRRVVAVTAAVAVAAACSSGSGTATRTTTTTTTSTTSTTTTTTTEPVTVPLSPAASAKDAATRFVNAWRDGNRLAAQSIAVPAAVDAVFSAGDPGSPQSRGCNSPPADSPVLCVYKTAAGELQIRVQPGSDGWIVDQAIVSPA